MQIYTRKNYKKAKYLIFHLNFIKLNLSDFMEVALLVSTYLFKVATIDASKRDYNNLLNRFVSENMEQFYLMKIR